MSDTQKKHDINTLRIKIASPEQILDWSYGEVKKPETINYRSLRPERDGLFCERIFGTTRDWECWCGKFKSKRYKGTVCERCGVEVTEKKVRRERCGHIKLATPVAHVWFYKSQPSIMSYLLEMKKADFNSIFKYESYVVIDPGQVDELEKCKVLSESEYEELVDKYGEDSFRAGMGAEAIYELLKGLDLQALIDKNRKALEAIIEKSGKTDSGEAKKATSVIKYCSWFLDSGNRPEWMILTVLPVIPPDLRPMVQLDGGRFATTDLNELYRRVINRNNRLQRLISIQAPDIIVRNEKRMLQEAVDCLLDNGKVESPAKGASKRDLKSLADQLKGKQGRFRQNLLGKRVDYSGRSVIVVGPELKMHQCGVPSLMALELFKPFLIRRLHDNGTAPNVKKAKAMVEEGAPEVWAILDDVVKEHPVMLNRAPTLHRLGFQAFEPVLVDGKALKLHPLVCHAFNADFDGDQMAIHVPLSEAAQLECWTLMLSTTNLLDPANGKPIAYPSQDMVLGIYYLTKERFDLDRKEKRKHFESIAEIEAAIDAGSVSYNERIYYRLKKGLEIVDEKGNKSVSDGLAWTETTPGRIIFNSSIPLGVPFQNYCLGDKQLKKLITATLETKKPSVAVELLDSVKDLGYKYATLFGATIGLSDMIVPEGKKDLIKKAEAEEAHIKEQLLSGTISEEEKKSRVISLWNSTKNELTDLLMKEMREDQHGFNPLFMMADSGARGSSKQISQLGAMRGIMTKPNGDNIELPVKSNFKEGLSIIEFFFSSNGARKGLTDTALKTARAGYLTRKLVDVAQDVVVTMEDCHTINGIWVSADASKNETLQSKIAGSFPVDDIVHPFLKDEEGHPVVLAKANELITNDIAARIEDAGVEKVLIRSVLTCEADHGVCKKCYGRNYATNKTVEIGEAVGVVAAQSIGQPGTQLTMRTFHAGGIATVSSNEKTFPYPIIVEGINSARFVTNSDGKRVFPRKSRFTATKVLEEITGKYSSLLVEDGMNVGKGYAFYKDHAGKDVLAKYNGKMKVLGDRTFVIGADTEVEIPVGAVLASGTDNDAVIPADEVVFTFDPFNELIIAEEDSKIVEMRDFVARKSYLVVENHVSGVKEWHTVSRDKLGKYNPTVVVETADSMHKEYTILGGSTMHFQEAGEIIKAGDVIASAPKEDASKSKDIAGGLPLVNSLFDATKTATENYNVIAHVSGKVEKIKVEKGYAKITILDKLSEIYPEAAADGKSFRHVHKVPTQGIVLLVREGDEVQCGDKLCDAQVNSREVLTVQGETAVLSFLVKAIQDVYREQDIEINEKHLSIIIRQMLRTVEIVRSNDTKFIENQKVDKIEFMKENEKMKAEGKVPAIGRPCLSGVSDAARNSESFISGASFAHTVQTLTEAAIAGKTDELKGLKENVIIGKLIPAGTGFVGYRDIVLTEDQKLLEEQRIKDANKVNEVVYDDDADIEEIGDMKSEGVAAEINEAMTNEE
ncbi:MAG: DNA-directed RNA polymerase subunit beta' [Candidatus Ornithospirochaeta sp.]